MPTSAATSSATVTTATASSHGICYFLCWVIIITNLCQIFCQRCENLSRCCCNSGTFSQEVKDYIAALAAEILQCWCNDGVWGTGILSLAQTKLKIWGKPQRCRRDESSRIYFKFGCKLVHLSVSGKTLDNFRLTDLSVMLVWSWKNGDILQHAKCRPAKKRGHLSPDFFNRRCTAVFAVVNIHITDALLHRKRQRKQRKRRRRQLYHHPGCCTCCWILSHHCPDCRRCCRRCKTSSSSPRQVVTSSQLLYCS